MIMRIVGNREAYVIHPCKLVAVVATVLVLAAPGLASSPEGSGNIAVAAQWLPMRQNNGFDLIGQVFQVSADAPLFSGLGLKTDFGESDAFSHGVGHGSGFIYDNWTVAIFGTEAHAWIPVPAASVLDSKGNIHFSYHNTDIKVRVHPVKPFDAAPSALVAKP